MINKINIIYVVFISSDKRFYNFIILRILKLKPTNTLLLFLIFLNLSNKGFSISILLFLNNVFIFFNWSKCNVVGEQIIIN